MYEGDPYGDEIEGGGEGEDRNDGLNALVRLYNLLIKRISFRTSSTSSASTRT
jgi:hypothetical protein